MLKERLFLTLARCPHCGVDTPHLGQSAILESVDHRDNSHRQWGAYMCNRCGGMVFVKTFDKSDHIESIYPHSEKISDEIPSPAKEYLSQAIDSIQTPAGAVMLAASAIDAMLKNKGYKGGALNSRINKAAEDHLITVGMSEWAHLVRLDANAQRHADESVPLPTSGEATRSVEFAKALAEFLFVLPAKVKKGIERNKEDEKPQ